MTSLLYLRDILDVHINKNVFTVIGLGFFIFAKYKDLIPIILFTLPLMCGLPGNFFLPIWCVLVVQHQLKHRTLHRPAIVFVLLFSIWEIIIYLMYPFQIPTTNYIGYVCSLLLICLLITDTLPFDYSVSIISFLIGCCVLLTCIYFIYMKDPVLIVLDGGMRMGGDAYAEKGIMSLHTNANSIGFLSAVAISISLTLFYYKKLHVIPFIISIITCIFCGMFAVSRTWAISVAFCFILYFIFQRKNKKMGYTMLFALGMGLIYYLSHNNNILEIFIDRFTGDEIQTGGQRTTLFADYNNFLVEHPINLLLGTSAQLYKEVTNLFHSTHNGLQQIWLSYGIIGFIIFMYAYIIKLKSYYTKGQYMACLPMIITFLFLQTIQVLNPHYGLYPILVSFFVMKMINRESWTNFKFQK